MQIDEFLNGRSIASLQLLQWLWAPGTPRSSSKSQLLRLLRGQMLSPERARESFAALEEPHQRFLHSLLRLDGYHGDTQCLAHRLPTGPPSPQATRDILADLARRGFLRFEKCQASGHTDTFYAEVPQELGDVLAEALNLDTREPALMLSLRSFLAQLPPDLRRQALGGHDLGPDALPPELLDPDAIERRIAALGQPAIERAARLALTECAGALPLERFPSLGLDIEAVDPPAWRAALEGSLLGTFGHLSLLELGLGDDHECLVLYHEIVAAHAAARGRPEGALDHEYTCGIDFLTDLATTVDFVRASPSKLTGAGRFFKGTRNQLSPHTALHSTFFMDEDSLLTFKLTVARELALVELHADGRLHATRSAAEWEALPLARQACSVLDVMLRLGETAAPPRHFQALADAARRTLLEMQPGLWRPTAAFIAAAQCRYVARLLEQGPPSESHGEPADPPAWGYPRAAASLGAIAEAVREPLLRALNYAGLLDIGRGGDRTFVRASPLAPALLGATPPPAPGRLVMVNPDFEVVLFPEEGHVELLHRLCAFCQREKNEVTLHLRLSQASVERAVLRGIGADEILATLRDHCRVPLAQNIEYSIRTWAQGIHPAEIRTLHVLELPSADVLDAALQLPEIAPLVLQRLSPTAIALSAPQLDPKAEEALKQLGVHLM